MPEYYAEHEQNPMQASPNWHSGLKTLGKSRYPQSPIVKNPRVYKNGADPDRWDVENYKTVKRSQSAPPVRRKFVNDGEWSSGLKTLDDSRVVSREDRIAELRKRSDRGAIEDWEYTSTMRKTLEKDETQRGHESWFTESHKVLPDEEARGSPVPMGGGKCSSCISPRRPPLRSPRASPHYPQRLLETETVPTTEWSAGHKVVPANRRRRFVTNNHDDYTYRAASVQKDTHQPSDATWFSENFKVVDRHHQPRPRPHSDEWESGLKTVPEDDLARERRFHRIHHPHSWLEESHKTLPYSYTKGKLSKATSSKGPPRMGSTLPDDPYRFQVTGTGWDSGLKTFGPEEASPVKHNPRNRIPYALNNDWYTDSKQLPRDVRFSQRSPYVIAGTGWDSGLKTLPPHEQDTSFKTEILRDRPIDLASDKKKPLYHLYKGGSKIHNPTRPRTGNDYWDLDNRKTLPWETTHTRSYGGEYNRHIMLPRARDMAQLQERITRHDDRYVY